MSHRKSGLSGKVETEVVLIIKDRAEQTAKAIADLSIIADYRLTHRRSLTIHDTYFDTDSKYFAKNRITFRIRQSSHGAILSVKSSPQKLARGGASRVESEHPWSYGSLARVSEELGLETPDRMIFKQSARSPLKVLTKAGFEIIQDRLTQRKSRDLVVFRKGKSFRFAELAIDGVTYIFRKGRVRLIELEIEAKAPGALPRIRRVVDCLLSDYPSLQVWAHGKFLTGLAINRLLRKRSLSDLSRQGLVRTRVFQVIDQTIRKGQL
ncbi:MAG TPA: CYTH domain-containing protein [Candidatus Bathyarchaeia archaeon]|nr:CYTH domain-containing protein [Candidatus Bathyarchaeia archaeon]